MSGISCGSRVDNRTGVDNARTKGVKLGRHPSPLTSEECRAALAEHGSVRKAATALGVRRSTLFARLKAAP